MTTKVPIKSLFYILLFSSVSLISAQAPADAKLDQAVAALRNVSAENLNDAQKEAKAKEIDDAWKLLISKGPEASTRLKDEIEKVDTGKIKDDFFKLNATVVLWNIGKANEAEYIAKVWDTTPISRQYTYVFLTAFEAAQTQDARVLPMLRTILRDDKSSIYIAAHAMNVAWPLSQEFIWGSFGPKGLPVLADILERSNDEVELKSAICLLAKAQYLPALPRIRQLASSDMDQVRRQAIEALGLYGHPTDFDRLVSGLKSSDPKELFSCAFALYEFEDARAVKELIPLLSKGDDQLRVEVSLALLHLLTPESLSAVKDFAAKTSNPEVKAFLSRSITLREDKLPKDYKLRSRDEQARILTQQRNAELTISSNERPFSNRQLLDALRIWKEKGRIYDSGVDWVGEAKMIAAAQPENIDQLLETKAAFYRRLSDECLYETADIDKVVKYVSRSRYRLGIGVISKSDLK